MTETTPKADLMNAKGKDAASQDLQDPRADHEIGPNAILQAVPLEAVAVARRPMFRDLLESLLVTVILALFGTTFLLQAFKIPTSSMEDTLLIGDHIMVNKLAFAPPSGWVGPLLPYREIRRGDVIVFKYPVSPGTHFVKRVIGLPGDRVRIVRRQVEVNGRLLDEGYKVHKIGTVEEFRDYFPGPPVGPVLARWAAELPRHLKDGWLVVPPGYYFAMGDNRDFSSDSRYWGFVPRANILGRPLVVYWSLNSTSRDYQASGMRERLAGIVDIVRNFGARTRWNRMFRMIHGSPE
jgi:signal peptidase I